MDELKFYFSIFLRRLPWFVVLATVITAVAVSVAISLPPAYVSQMRLVVESPQIPDEMAASTVRTPALEQLQIIEQRLLTRANLLDISRRLDVLPDLDQMSPDDIVRAMRARTEIYTQSGRDAATMMVVSFEAGDPNKASGVLNEYLNIIQEADAEFRRGRAGDTLEFFEQEVERLDGELSAQSARIISFKQQNSDALPDTLDFRMSKRADRPIKRLTDYADTIRAGQRGVFPALDRTEIGDLGRALKRMQERLEGKAYVEAYVQKLTHEVKSPLSAIHGAAELLAEDVPPERKQRFLSNIRTEAERIQAIVDRMLQLAALEFKQHLKHREPIQLDTMASTVLESKQPMIIAKQLMVTQKIDPAITFNGDPFLLHQALANLVQNAIDFCTIGGCIGICGGMDDRQAWIAVEDNGCTIPTYAVDKIFDKFFSLKRPDSGMKSTGLGLNLVKEVALLHGGHILLENISPQGVRATLTLPR